MFKEDVKDVQEQVTNFQEVDKDLRKKIQKLSMFLLF